MSDSVSGDDYAAEDLAAAGYARTDPKADIDRQVARAYEASLRRKRDAVQGAIEYLRKEWPSVVRVIESEALVRGTESLIIAFRRWCISAQGEPPSVEEFREILLVAAEIRADLDRADEVGIDHQGRRLLRDVDL